MFEKGEPMNFIKSIDPESIAEELEIVVGDALISINGQPVIDIIDYMYLCNDEYLEVEIQKVDGEIWVYEIDKTYDEPLGITFDNPIIDCAKHCSNKCVFCFIDQLPKGMRETLYFKDDDSRLSFLQGNFVTLTNLKEADLDRIIRYKISPINVSVHTTDADLRRKMLGNRFAGNILERLKQLTEGGIVVNAQVVLCPGYNDEEALSSTLNDLMALYPNLNSVAVVPIGLTDHREGLPVMMGYDHARALSVINRVTLFQNHAFSTYGTRFAFLADEFYIKANVDFPSDEAYEGYLQLEDGIGMIRKLSTEMALLLKKPSKKPIPVQRIAIGTGVAAAPYLKTIMDGVMRTYPTVSIDVFPVINNFFGENITVSGLVTGKDLMLQLTDLKGYDRLLLPASMFRAGESVLLDDVHIDDLETHFGIQVIKVDYSGEHLMHHILNGGTHA